MEEDIGPGAAIVVTCAVIVLALAIKVVAPRILCAMIASVFVGGLMAASIVIGVSTRKEVESCREVT